MFQFDERIERAISNETTNGYDNPPLHRKSPGMDAGRTTSSQRLSYRPLQTLKIPFVSCSRMITSNVHRYPSQFWFNDAAASSDRPLAFDNSADVDSNEKAAIIWPLDAYPENDGSDFSFAASRFATTRVRRIRTRRAADDPDGNAIIRHLMNDAKSSSPEFREPGRHPPQAARRRPRRARAARVTAPRMRSRESARTRIGSFQ